MKNQVQKVSLISGIVFLLLGVAGLISGGVHTTTTEMLRLFDVNVLHNAVHLGFGVWGIVVSRFEAASEDFVQIAGVSYLVLSLLGFFAPTGFRVMPIGGHNIWLHAIFGLTLLYFGFDKHIADDNLRLE